MACAKAVAYQASLNDSVAKSLAIVMAGYNEHNQNDRVSQEGAAGPWGENRTDNGEDALCSLPGNEGQDRVWATDDLFTRTGKVGG